MIKRYDLVWNCEGETKMDQYHDGSYVLFTDHEAEIARLRKALHDISVVGLLSDEPDGPRCRRMREIAEKAGKEKGNMKVEEFAATALSSGPR